MRRIAAFLTTSIVAYLLAFTAATLSWADPVELEARLNVEHELLMYSYSCDNQCNGEPDCNPRHHFFLVVSWEPVPGAWRYNIWADPGNWGSTWVPGTETRKIIFSVDSTDHNYIYDWETHTCSDNPLFLYFLREYLGQFYAVPDVFHVSALITGEDPIESAPIDGGRFPEGPVFLIPGLELEDTSPTYAYAQLQPLADALGSGEDSWLGDGGFVLGENMFVVDNFNQSDTQQQKALSLQSFIEQKLQEIGYVGNAVRLVGYSEGARVARAYMNLQNGQTVRDVDAYLSIGGPHHGSFWVDAMFVNGREEIARFLDERPTVSMTQFMQLTSVASEVENTLWPYLPPNTVTISGRSQLFPDYPSPLNDTDLVVSNESSMLEGAHNVVIDGAIHMDRIGAIILPDGLLRHEQSQRRIAESLVIPHYGPGDVKPDWQEACATCSETGLAKAEDQAISEIYTTQFSSQVSPGLQRTIPELARLSPGEQEVFAIPVDPANAAEFYFRAVSDSLIVTLRDPNGHEVYQESTLVVDATHVDAPIAGDWEVTVENPSTDMVDRALACLAFLDSEIGIIGEVDMLCYEPGGSGVYTVSVVGADVDLSSVSMDVSLFAMSEADTDEVELILNDEGIPPDQVEGDGTYSGEFQVGSDLAPYALGTRVMGTTIAGESFTRGMLAWAIVCGTTAVPYPDDGPVSDTAGLRNFPNPFRSQTTIHYDLSTPGHVRLDIFDATGRQIATLVDDVRHPGHHVEHWNGLDTSGRRMPSGVYFYQVKAGNLVETKRMVLVR